MALSWWRGGRYKVVAARGSRTMAAVTIENLNPRLIKLQYAVRGPLVIRAGEIEEELRSGKKKPFNKVIRANIGDSQAMGQPPITFIRQVIACVAYPELMFKMDFPKDVKKKACSILDGCQGGSIGSYTDSLGLAKTRKHVAKYIERRDCHPAKPGNIVLCTGASTGIKNVLQLLINEVDCKPSGVMVPIPQYPLYSASLAEFGLEQVGYYLQEEKNWALDIDELDRALKEASKTCKVRALCVINPGNPTGQVLTRDNIEKIIEFAHHNNLLLCADEVYQDNIYAEGSEFHSFKKVLVEMGDKYKNLELASFMSASKGYMGECGMRAGWMELLHLQPEVRANLYKTISAMLCSPSLGQAAIDCVARPPREGEPSYDLWLKEKTCVLESLRMRAEMIVKAFNEIEGFKCNVVQGAMYAFPQIKLPRKAIEAAKAANLPPDTFYAFQLLEGTGICIVPGTGFGQKPGTYHFRTTILPQPALLEEMLDIFQTFHKKFTKKYS